MTLAVNGRFLRSPHPTGMHRVSRSLLDAARAAGLDAEVLVPPGVADARADRVVWSPRGRAGDHVWEQVVLPAATLGRPLLSLLNTAPVARRRAAVMVHDLAFRVGPHWYAHSMRLYGAVVMAAARRARLVLTVSHCVAGELVAAGVAAERVEVVANAVDRVGPAPAGAVAAARTRHRLERPYLLMVGWSNPRKDARTAVAAHLRLRGRIAHDLVLVGADSPTFRRADLASEPSVRVLGYVDDGELRALLTGAAAFVYPTRYEGFGLPPLEALDCGVPALVSDLPVLRESSGGAAVFVAAGDVGAWSEAMAAALAGHITAAAPPSRTWADAGRELVQLALRLG